MEGIKREVPHAALRAVLAEPLPSSASFFTIAVPTEPTGEP